MSRTCLHNQSVRYKEKDEISYCGRPDSMKNSWGRNTNEDVDAKHKHNDSLSTCSSDGSPSQKYIHIPNKNDFFNKRVNSSYNYNKIKVELCRNFVEKGYCPYQTRCKFAHGVEELRAKDTCKTSQLYRTRKCKVFFEGKECKFGQRCNFMHQNRSFHEIIEEHHESVLQSLRINFVDLKLEWKIKDEQKQSRLLTILRKEVQIMQE